jgi:thiamine transport system substrate-binding protein
MIAGMVMTLALGACAPEPPSLTVMTHDSFAVSKEVITFFEQENGVEIEFLFGGDAGGMLNKAILSKNAPVADVLFGVDNTFLSRALNEGIFERYTSPLLDEIPDEFILDREFRALPVDYGDVCINVDVGFFKERNLLFPEILEDLTDPAYRGMLVVQNPATSSPGLAFLLATIAEYGPEGYLGFWARLKDNGVVVVNDWETAYYVNFSGSSGQGPQPMVVSYGTSPAAEVIFSEEPLTEAPTRSLTGRNMCFRQVEFAGILAGTQKRELAEKFIDYMLSEKFQEDIPLNMFVFPVNRNARAPEEFIAYVQVPAEPAALSMETISAERESWIEAWRGLMLQ